MKYIILPCNKAILISKMSQNAEVFLCDNCRLLFNNNLMRDNSFRIFLAVLNIKWGKLYRSFSEQLYFAENYCMADLAVRRQYPPVINFLFFSIEWNISEMLIKCRVFAHPIRDLLNPPLYCDYFRSFLTIMKLFPLVQ